MITFDSPVATVFGDAKGKRDKLVDKLGIETVGQLMNHFPRRYLKTGELTRVEDLAEGQLLTVVGEIASAVTKTYQDRRTGKPAYRLETVLETDGPSLRMTFFSKAKHISEWQEKRVPVGRRGLFLGQAGRFQSQWQLTNPTMLLFGETDDEETVDIGAYYPIYPLTKGLDSWDIQRAVSFARTVLDIPEALPEEIRTAHKMLDARTAYDWIHAPDDYGQVARAQRRFRFEEALVTQLVLGRRRREVRALGARGPRRR